MSDILVNYADPLFYGLGALVVIAVSTGYWRRLFQPRALCHSAFWVGVGLKLSGCYAHSWVPFVWMAPYVLFLTVERLRAEGKE